MQTAVEKRCIKDELEREELVIGGYVTINDSSDVIDVYILEKMHDNGISSILTLELSLAKDDVIVVRKEVETDSLIYVDDSFVSTNGRLSQIRQFLVDGETDKFIVFPS